MSKTATAEKRRAPRVPASAQVTVRHMRHQQPGTARDISDGGIFLFTEEEMEPGSEMELVLMMPPGMGPLGGRWVSCYATVVRVEPRQKYNFGVAARIDYCEAVDVI
jgi:PilZ domain-containing protein